MQKPLCGLIVSDPKHLERLIRGFFSPVVNVRDRFRIIWVEIHGGADAQFCNARVAEPTRYACHIQHPTQRQRLA